jgi:hypothetical protein
VRGRELADPLTSNPQSRDGTIENYGLTSEVPYVSKLDCAKIIPTAKKKFLGETKWSDSSLTAGSNPQRGMGICGEGAELLASSFLVDQKNTPA